MSVWFREYSIVSQAEYGGIPGNGLNSQVRRTEVSQLSNENPLFPLVTAVSFVTFVAGEMSEATCSESTSKLLTCMERSARSCSIRFCDATSWVCSIKTAVSVLDIVTEEPLRILPPSKAVRNAYTPTRAPATDTSGVTSERIIKKHKHLRREAQLFLVT